jgi:hypothetical protein
MTSPLVLRPEPSPEPVEVRVTYRLPERELPLFLRDFITDGRWRAIAYEIVEDEHVPEGCRR